MGFTRETFKEAVDAIMRLEIHHLERDGYVAETITGFTRTATPVASILAGTRIDRSRARARLGHGGFVTANPLQESNPSLLRTHLALHHAEAVVYAAHQVLPDALGAVPGLIVMGAWPAEWLTYTRVALTGEGNSGDNEIVEVPEPIDPRTFPGLVPLEAWLVDLVPDVTVDEKTIEGIY